MLKAKRAGASVWYGLSRGWRRTDWSRLRSDGNHLIPQTSATDWLPRLQGTQRQGGRREGARGEDAEGTEGQAGPTLKILAGRRRALDGACAARTLR